MSHQDPLPTNLTPQETAAAARAATEAASAAAAAATDVASAAENEDTSAMDKPDENITTEHADANSNPLNPEPEDIASRPSQAPLAIPDEKKPDGVVEAALVAASAPLHDPSVLGHMAAAHRPATVSSVSPLPSVPHPSATSVQAQPTQIPAATHVPNLPSIVSPIQKKPSNLTPFICDVLGCGKAFGKKFNLKAHRRVHTGDEPFVCSYPTCGKRFKWKSSLTFHEGLHLNAPEEHAPPTAAELAAATSATAQATAAIEPTTAKKENKV